MSAVVRSSVRNRVARPRDLPAVLALVRQHRVEAHAEGVLTGQTPAATAAEGFRALLDDPAHRVVLAVLPPPAGPDRQVVGIELNASYLRSATSGTVTAVCTPVRRGRTLATYLIEVADDQGRPTASARLTCLVKEG